MLEALAVIAIVAVLGGAVNTTNEPEQTSTEEVVNE